MIWPGVELETLHKRLSSMNPEHHEPVWKDAYKEAASAHLQTYFGGFRGLTSAFPCLRDDYPWGDHRPDVVDSRIPAKNNTEYHGLETLAGQYHAAAMYAEASHHWLMAAWCRQIDKTTHGFNDAGHDRALSFCLKNQMFNEALEAWSKAAGEGPVPEPEAFGLSAKHADGIEERGAVALEAAFEATRRRPPE